MPPTPMLKTAVHKYGHLLFPKNEIWFANHALFPTPARDVVRSKKSFTNFNSVCWFPEERIAAITAERFRLLKTSTIFYERSI